MVIKTRFSNIIFSNFFIWLFMPISLLAMDQIQQNIYDQLILAVDEACAQYNNQRAVSLGAYNQALLDVLQNIVEAVTPSLQWANNRISVIRIDLEKANVQFNAIESILGKFNNLVGQARTRQQAAARLAQNPDVNDQDLLNFERYFNDRRQRASAIIGRIRNYAEKVEAELVAANDIDDNVHGMLNQINVPILGDNYNLQDINQSRANGAVAYHLKLSYFCTSFQNFNTHIYNIKNIADTIREDINLPDLDTILEEIEERAGELHIPR